MNRLLRQAKRFRVSLGTSSFNHRDRILHDLFQKTPSSIADFSDLAEQLPRLVPIVKTQPKFLQSDFLASVISGLGSLRCSRSVLEYCKMMRSLPERSSLLIGQCVIALSDCGLPSQGLALLSDFSYISRAPFVYNSLLKAFATSKNPDVKEVLQLLQRIRSAGASLDAYAVQSLVRLASQSRNNALIQETIFVLESLPANPGSNVQFAIMIESLCNSPQLVHRVPEILDLMVSKGVKPDRVTILALLRAATMLKDVTLGDRVWKLAEDVGVQASVQLRNLMVGLYSNCGHFSDAEKMFASVPEASRDAFSYTAIVLSRSLSNSAVATVEHLFDEMLRLNISLTDVLVVALLRAAGKMKSLTFGVNVVNTCERSKLGINVRVLIAAVDMFSKCSSAADAVRIFELIPLHQRPVAAYNALLEAYSGTGDLAEADRVFGEMLSDGIQPDTFTMLALLRCAASKKLLSFGKKVWRKAVELGLCTDDRVINASINMFGKCGDVSTAREIFNSIATDKRNVFSYTCMVQAYAFSSTSMVSEVELLVDEMPSLGITPHISTVLALLRGAAIWRNIGLGNRAWQLAGDFGARGDVMVVTAAMDMYGKCGDVGKAKLLFQGLSGTQHNTVSYNTLMLACGCDEQFAGDVEALFNTMMDQKLTPDAISVIALLKAASVTKDLTLGCRAWELAGSIDARSDIRVVNTAIIMFGKLGALKAATEVFQYMPEEKRDIVTYNSLSFAYAASEHYAHLVEPLFARVKSVGLYPDAALVVSLLRAAATLKDRAMAFRSWRVASDLNVQNDVNAATTAINMFGKCGAVAQSLEVFRRIPLQKRTTVTYNSLFMACSQSDIVSSASINDLLDEMIRLNLKLDPVTVFALFLLCVSTCDLLLARRAWSLAQEQNLHEPTNIANAAIDAFGKCGSVAEALEVFNGMTPALRNADTFVCLMRSYSLSETCVVNVESLYTDMIALSIQPDSKAVIELFRAAAIQQNLSLAMKASSVADEINAWNNNIVANTAISTFDKCGSPDDAVRVFDSIAPTYRNMISYNSVLLACSTSVSLCSRTLSLIHEMMDSNIFPDSVTLLAMLRSAAFQKDRELGTMAWNMAADLGVQGDLLLANAAIDMFGKCGSVKEAEDVFSQTPEGSRDLVSYNTMISACRSREAGNVTADRVNSLLDELLAKMQPDSFTILATLHCAASVNNITLGRRAWDLATQIGVRNEIMIANAAIDMFGKCGSLSDALRVFRHIPSEDRNSISYNSVLFAHSFSPDTGRGAEGILDQMKLAGITCNSITVVAILNCAAVAANYHLGCKGLVLARDLGCVEHDFVVSAAIHMYGRCRRPEEAEALFLRSPPSVASYCALIGAFALRGDGVSALRYFEQARSKFGLSEPLVVVCLQALSHSCMADAAVRIFTSLPPNLAAEDRVVTSMIDCYSRVGNLDHALRLVNTLQHPSTATMLTLLGGCRIHKNVEIGREMFDRIRAMDRTLTAAYILMYNIYIAAGQTDEAYSIQDMMTPLNLKKTSGATTAIVNGEVSTFYAHHKEHDMLDEIQAMRKELNDKLLVFGHVADESWVSDVNCATGEQRRQSLREHSERYALAYSVLVLPEGADIDLVNNLRVCGDCHETTKKLSAILKRRIYLRDSARYHCFENGKCDCGDSW